MPIPVQTQLAEPLPIPTTPILAEEDTRRLDRWLEKAVTAASVDEVLGEGE